MKKSSILKKGIAFLVIAFSIITIANAQPQKGERPAPPKPPTEEQIVQMVNKMSNELNLTEDQKSLVLKLHKQHFAEMETLMKKQKEQHQTNREEMKTLRKNFENSVKENLNEEQAKAFNEHLKNNRAQGGEPKQKR